MFLIELQREGTGFANFDPGTNAKGLAPGQLITYTGQYYQGIRQGSVIAQSGWNAPPPPRSPKHTKKDHISILCTHKFSIRPHREGRAGWVCKGLTPALMPKVWPRAS